MGVLKAMIKERFDYGIFKLIDHKKVDPTLKSVAVARLCMNAWDGFDSCGWIPNKYMNRKISHVVGFAPAICKFADPSQKEITMAKAVPYVYLKEVVIVVVSFELAKTAQLQYLEKRVDYIQFSSLEAHVAVVERHSSSVPSVENEDETSPAVAADVNQHDDDDEDWDVENAVSLDSVEQVGASNRPSDYKSSRQAVKTQTFWNCYQGV